MSKYLKATRTRCGYEVGPIRKGEGRNLIAFIWRTDNHSAPGKWDEQTGRYQGMAKGARLGGTHDLDLVLE